MLHVNKKLEFIGLTVGVFICFTLFGVVQEIMFRGKYRRDDEPDEIFTYSVAFAALQCIACSLFAKGLSLTQEMPIRNDHHVYYFIIGLLNVISVVTATIALQWISYPTQNVARAAEPVPTMIFSALWGKKSYSVQKYFFVLIVVIGVCAFMYEDSKQPGAGDDVVKGIYLMVTSVFTYALQGAAQDRLQSKSKQTTIEYMFHMNNWSSLILLCVMSVSGEGRDLVRFAEKDPSVVWQLALCLFLSTIGYYFLSGLIAHFGTLMSCLVTTTRKFVTVFLSVLLFNNALSLRQWIATVAIFSALIMDALFSNKPRAPEKTAMRPEVYKNSSELASVQSFNQTEVDETTPSKC